MIFNLFKSKPTLKELIPEGFVDIHSHILPGIDDGAKNIKESLALISEMKKLGFSKVIATPHTYPGLYNNTNESIEKSFGLITKKVPKDIKIEYGSEYMIDNLLIKKAKNKELLCLKDNYVLVEMSFISKPIGLYEILYEIKVNDYIPILAHPERYLFLTMDNMYKIKKFGCLFQANLLSATGYYGKSVRINLDRLLKSGLIDFVGSDIHNIKHIAAFENKVMSNEVIKLREVIDKNNQFS